MGSHKPYSEFKNKRQLGIIVEKQAIAFLKQQGLKLLSRNFFSYHGEIDLIMLDGDYLVFIEVRLRNNPNYGDSTMTVNYQKQKKISKTAQYFLIKHPCYRSMPCRFDVVGVSEKTGINWIKDAFYLQLANSHL